MLSQQYELRDSCFGILTENGKRFSIHIQKGDLVTIVNGPLDGVRMVEVDWNGKTVLLFTEDLRQCGMLVQEHASPLGGIP